MLVLLCSDLDNTLIYSYKHDIGISRQCVEVYEEREVSFMTSRSVRMLAQVNDCLRFVPTTTRTVEQYRRVRLGTGEPEYALVCNGGVLLVKGVRDRAWYEESLRLISECGSGLKMAAQLLEQDENRCFEVRDIEGLFLFTKSRDPFKTAEGLRGILDPAYMDVFTNGMKIYAVPRKLSKGYALRRLKEKLKAPAVIAAGDSGFDIPMLLEADYSFLPQALAEQMEDERMALRRHMCVCAGETVFSDEMLDRVLGWVRERKEPET